jgi:hypothetical protein
MDKIEAGVEIKYMYLQKRGRTWKEIHEDLLMKIPYTFHHNQTDIWFQVEEVRSLVLPSKTSTAND